MPLWLLIFVNIMAAIGGVLALCFILMTIRFRDSHVITSSSFIFNLVVLASCVGLCASVSLLAIEPSRAICSARWWITVELVTVALGALFSKSYRIWKILHNPHLRQANTSNTALFKIIGAMLLFVTIPLACLTALDPSIPETAQDIPSGQPFQRCSRTLAAPIFLGLLWLLLAWGSILSLRTRNAPAAFNESLWNGISIYNIMFCLLVMAPLDFLLEGWPDAQYLTRSFGILYPSIIVVSCTSGPKLQAILAGKHDHPGKTVHGTQISVHLPKPPSPRTPIRHPLAMAKDAFVSERDLNANGHTNHNNNNNNGASDLDEPSTAMMHHAAMARAYVRRDDSRSRFSPSQTPSTVPHYTMTTTPHHHRDGSRGQHNNNNNGGNDGDKDNYATTSNGGRYGYGYGNGSTATSPNGTNPPVLNDLVLQPLASTARSSGPLSMSLTHRSGGNGNTGTNNNGNNGNGGAPHSPLFVAASPRWTAGPPPLSTVDEQQQKNPNTTGSGNATNAPIFSSSAAVNAIANRRRTPQNIASVLEEKNRRRTMDLQERRRTMDTRFTMERSSIPMMGMGMNATFGGMASPSTMERHNINNNNNASPSLGNRGSLGTSVDDRSSIASLLNRRRTAESGSLNANRLLAPANANTNANVNVNTTNNVTGGLQPRRLLDINTEAAALAQSQSSQPSPLHVTSPSSVITPSGHGGGHQNSTNHSTAPMSSPSSTNQPLPQGSPSSTNVNSRVHPHTGITTGVTSPNERSTTTTHDFTSTGHHHHNNTDEDHDGGGRHRTGSITSNGGAYGSGSNASVLSMGAPAAPPSSPIVSAIFPGMRTHTTTTASNHRASLTSNSRLPDLPMATITAGPLAGDGHSPDSMVSVSSTTAANFSLSSSGSLGHTNIQQSNHGHTTPPPLIVMTSIGTHHPQPSPPRPVVGTRASLRVASPPPHGHHASSSGGNGTQTSAALHASVTAEEKQWRLPAAAVAVTTLHTPAVAPSPRTPTLPHGNSAGSVGSTTVGAMELSPPLRSQASPVSTPTPPDLTPIVGASTRLHGTSARGHHVHAASLSVGPTLSGSHTPTCDASPLMTATQVVGA